jgi:hypothetical protein
VTEHDLLLTNAAIALVLTGLIWTVQLVHYPLFALVGQDEWPRFHRAHGWRVTLLVGWLMPLELAAALALALSGSPAWLGLVQLTLVLVIWLVTALVAVPLHRRLEQRHDPVAIQRLIAFNWIRTAAWTGRALLLGWAAGTRP